MPALAVRANRRLYMRSVPRRGAFQSPQFGESFMYWRILLMLATAAAAPLRAEDRPAQAGDFIEVFQGLFGEHKGERKGHAKGVCAVGSFTGSAEAARMFSAPLFSGTRWPAQIRFSMAGGDPAVADNARSPRGLAAQFELGDGRVHNIAKLSTPVFGAATPESFLGLLRASLPGPDGRPDADRVAAYRAAHPDTLPQFRWLQQNPPPWSYASAQYFGLHTFHFATADGERAVRWRLQPRDGVRGLADEERGAAPRDFLAARLGERVARGPVLFDWIVTLGQPGDSESDPSLAWPDGRTELVAGTLSVTAVGGDACTGLNFDPNVLSEGIRPGDDPILKMRSPAYAISFGKRLGGR